MMQWRQDAGAGLMIAVAGIIGLLIGLQVLAMTVTSAVAGIPANRLTVFEVVGLWGTATPTTRTGVTGYDIAHWVLAAGTGLLLLGLISWGAVLLVRRAKDPQNLRGLASSWKATRHAGRRQLLARAGSLRPSLTRPEPWDVGFLLCRFRGVEVWMSCEDPVIVIGPSRSGKGFRIIIRKIITSAGAVVTTSCKIDNVLATMTTRATGGRPVLIFAPGVDAVRGLGHELRWDPIRGCQESTVLERRLGGLIPANAFSSGTTNGGHWDTKGRQLASCLFHAAALARHDVDTLWDWVLNPVRAKRAVTIIQEHPDGMTEKADMLARTLGAAPDKLETNWDTLKTVLSFLESPAVREWLRSNFSSRRGGLWGGCRVGMLGGCRRLLRIGF